jgi:GH24 family phage-related lysozyme (muramidase)
VLIAFNAKRAVPESTTLFRNLQRTEKSASECRNDRVRTTSGGRRRIDLTNRHLKT